MSHIQTKIKNNAKFLVLFSSFLLLLLVIKLVCVFYLANPTEIKPALADGATFVVDSTDDDSDFSAGDGVCDTDDGAGDGPCTLRAAIEEVNAGGGGDTISIGAIGTTTPESVLPSISRATTTISGPGSDGFVIDGISTTDVSGIHIYSASTTVSGITVKNFDNHGIFCGASTCINSLIYNNHVLNNEWDGIQIYSDSNDGNDKNNIVSNNTVESNGGSAIGVFNANNNTIINNITNSNNNGPNINHSSNNNIYYNVSTSDLTGIALNFATSTTIQNSTTTLCTYSGINITGSDGSIIQNSTSTSNTQYGITINSSNNISVLNSDFSSNNIGISISGSNTEGNIITDNTINDTTGYFGIYILTSADSNTISNNTIDTTPSSFDCIQILTDNNIVSGNTLTNCGQDGIALVEDTGGAGGGTSLAAGNTFQNNTITSVGRHGIFIGEEGTPGTGNSISGNTISSCIQNGIKILNTSEVTITSNTIYSNLYNGIDLNTSGNNTISSNTIYSNSSSPSYATTLNYGIYNEVHYVNGFDGMTKAVYYLIGDSLTTVSSNDYSITGLDGTDDIYLVLVNDGDVEDLGSFTIYTTKSEADFLTWCQANVAAACVIDYYSADPIWQAGGAGIAYTWNESALPSGGSVNTSYYTTTGLSVSYDGDDYNESLYGIEWVIYLTNAGMNLAVPVMNVDTIAGLDGETALDLVLVDDDGAFTGKVGAVVPTGFDITGMLSEMLGGAPVAEVCRESNVYTGNGDGEDYTYKPIASWTGCAGATMSSGWDDPANLVGYSTDPPTLTASFAYSGINLTSATSTTMTSNTIYDNGNGITFSGTSDDNTVDGGTITGSLGYDLQHSASGNNILDNLSFTSTSTNVTAGQVDVYYDTRGYVKDSGGSPISGAVCSVAPEAGGSSTSLGTTASNGYTSYASVNAFDIDSTGIINGNSHIMTATKNAANYTSSATAIDSINKTISISSAPLSNIGGLGGAYNSNSQTTTPTEGETTTNDSESSDTETGDNTEEDTTQDDADTSEGDESTEGEGTDNNQGTSGNNNSPGTSSAKGLSTTITHSPEETKLIKFEDKSTVYIVNEKNKTLEPILSESVFTDRGFSWDQIENTSSENYQNYQTGSLLFYQNGVLVKSPYDSSVYKLENNTKRPITNANIFTRLGYMWDQIKTVAQDILDMLPVGKGIR